MLRIDVITLFPQLVDDYCTAGVVGRGRRSAHFDLRLHDPREHTDDVHRTVDDAPFGGGAGMVLKADPLFRCVEAAEPPRPLFLLGPGGRRFDQALAGSLATTSGFSLLCGRYEGVDERVARHLVDDELSIGDVVLAGGELAALVVIEAVVRLLPGVLGNVASSAEESFADGLLEQPQWTRPATYRGWSVPEVMRSGDHARMERWRLGQRVLRTQRQRPDLIDARGGLSADERAAADAALADGAADTDADEARGGGFR